MPDKIYLWSDCEAVPSSITPFLLPGTEPRAAVLVIPGGAYGGVCRNTEGIPIAKAFNQLGLHAFVLDYRVAPNRWPAPQQDAIRAMRIIRANAEKWNVIPDRIASCGFSAGGHLAGSLGVLTDLVNADNGDSIDRERGDADGMILCYGVLVFESWSHVGTYRNLTGEDPELLKLCSLEKHDLSKAPPAFVWATVTDQLVDYHNSIVFAEAMNAAKRPCELHIYPHGDHGMLLGLETPDVCAWPSAAVNFLQNEWERRDTGCANANRYTNGYQYEAEKRAGLTI